MSTETPSKSPRFAEFFSVSAMWYSAVTVWLVALAVSLVAVVFDSDAILAAFPVMLGVCTVAVVLCYGLGHLLFRLVPSIAAVVLVVWLLHIAGVPPCSRSA